MTRRSDARVATAYHEAGHVVAAYFLRVPIQHVTIRADGISAGHVRYLRFGMGLAQTHARGIVALAGRRHSALTDRAVSADTMAAAIGMPFSPTRLNLAPAPSRKR